MLAHYLERLRDIHGSRLATNETSYYSPLETLINNVGARLSSPVRAVSQLADTGAGNPDYGFVSVASGDLLGVIEAKPTSDDSLHTASGEQVTRYYEHYGVVLVTNYRDFVLVTRDERGQPTVEMRYSLAADETTFWSRPIREIIREHDVRFADFLEGVLTRSAPIAGARDLAGALARYAREALARLSEQEAESLAPLREAMTQALGLHFQDERGDAFFRSSLVQTLFYGLFSSWILWNSRDGESRFDWHLASEYLQLPLVAGLFEEIARPSRLRDTNLREPLEWAEAALNRVVREQFFRDFDEQQAIQYFYEPFLEAFDPDLREQLGVWYTPPEIVRYQVARVHRLLQEELGVRDGLADERVVVLDPVVGTGSYLIEVLRTIHRTLEASGQTAIAGLRIKQATMTRVLGFEILPAPFVVAHLQLGLLLQTVGAPLRARERVGIFLTNSLTGWDPREVQSALPLFPDLEREREAASRVKREAPILVILGNPPYNRYAGVAVEEEAELISPYKTGLFDRWRVRKQLLDDLYIRFYRLAERRIAEVSGRGVISYISNSSWLDGISHPQMRERFVHGFDQIWIDNLHGNRLISERTPNGRTCETIFHRGPQSPGIKVGTAIVCLVKRGTDTQRSTARVLYRDVWGHANVPALWGSANEKRQALLDGLAQEEREPGANYDEITPSVDLRWVLVPTHAVAGYAQWRKLTELFPASFSGLNTNRDAAVIAIDRETLVRRMRAYYDPDVSDEEIQALCPTLMRDAARFDAKETRRELLRQNGFRDDRIVRLAYRPYDDRWVYWEEHGKLLNEKRPEFFEQCWQDNIFLSASQKGRRGGFNTPTVVSKLGDLHLQDPWSQFFPLWLRRTEFGQTSIGLNVDSQLLRSLGEAWGFRFTDDGGQTGAEPALAEDLFYHTAAVLQSPAYRGENEGDLRQEWPRIPVPSSREVLATSAGLGRQVVALLQPDVQMQGVTTGAIRTEIGALAEPSRVGGGQITEEDLSVTIRYGGVGRWMERAYTEEERRCNPAASLGDSTGDVFWNDVGYWRNVPPAVWNFTVGGYPVVKKWLSYRHIDKLGRPMRLEEVICVMDICRRIASLLLLGSALDDNYRHVVDG